MAPVCSSGSSSAIWQCAPDRRKVWRPWILLAVPSGRCRWQGSRIGRREKTQQRGNSERSGCKGIVWRNGLTYLEAIQKNLIQILSFLICSNPTSWLFFQSRKQNWKNICPRISSELLMRADSDPPLFSLRQQNFNVMAPPGIEPSSSAHKAKTLPWS